MSESKKCLKCGGEKKIIGRGLCSKCYAQERTFGTLDQNFPKSPVIKLPAVESVKAKAKKTIRMSKSEMPADPIPKTPEVLEPDFWKFRAKAEEALHPGRRLFLAALDAIGEMAEAAERIAVQVGEGGIADNVNLSEVGDGLRSSAQIGYAAIGRLTREARKTCII